MDWLALLFAGCFEVVGVAGIARLNRGKTLAAYAMLLGGFTFSLLLLSYAMASIPMGTAYAVWTGIGTVGSAVLGMAVYGESRDGKRLLYISMILVAAVGLKLVS